MWLFEVWTKKKDQDLLMTMEKSHKFLVWLTMQQNSREDSNHEWENLGNKEWNSIDD